VEGGIVPTDVVTAVDLVKRYKGKKTPAVDGISFDIAQGPPVGLLGPNGAGKTTLIKMICGVTPPTTGRLLVYGAEPVRDPVTAKSAVGAMHQSAPFDEMLTVSDNLKIAARFRGLHWRSAEPWIVEIAAHLDLKDDIFSRLMFQCSGGQRQRLQLVRALMTIPKLLILDEPSAGLDVAGRHQVERFVRWLREEYGVTVIWTSHLIDEIERNCQRVMVVNKGKVLRFAHPRELVREYSHGHLQVELEDEVGAKAVLEWAEEAGYTAEAEDTVVRIEGKQTKEILAVLARHCQDAGVAISGVSNITDSLEQVFLRMTEEAE
jgi:ABC-type multidrug transport system ATPase subunit